jgi:hypothetical protein
MKLRAVSKSIRIDVLESRRLLAVTPVITVLNNQTTFQAGQAVQVNAVQTGQPIGADLGAGTPLTARYEWDFGDTNLGSEYNQLPGFNAGHIYDTPGTYDITLSITNQDGDVGVTHKTITIVDPTPAQTVYIDNTFTGVVPDPSGGIDVPSVTAAIPFLGDNTQLLFRRGETFTDATTINISFDNVTISAYGAGNAPILQVPSGTTQFLPLIVTTATADNTIINGLQFQASASARIAIAIQPAGTNLVVRKCNFQNLDDAFNCNLSPTGLMALDNISGVLKEYFSYIKGTDHVYLGNTVGDSATQHDFRTYGTRVLCYGNDVTNIPSGSGLDTLRVNDGAWIYWANNTLHDGQIIAGPLGPDSAGSNPGSGVNWLVIENNRELQVAGQWMNNNRLEIDAGVQHVVIRNNYIEATDTTGININTRSSLTWLSSQLPASPIPLPPVTIVKTSTDVMVLNNTVVNPDLGDGTHLGKKGCFIEVNGATTNAITLKNNLYVAPKLDTTAFSAAAVRVMSRNDLSNFVNGGISNNDWPKPSNATTRGVNYVSDGSRTGTAAYYTPAEWASSFPAKISGEKFEALLVSDISASLYPKSTSLAATGAAIITGIFTDLYGVVRTGSAWTDGAAQLLS